MKRAVRCVLALVAAACVYGSALSAHAQAQPAAPAKPQAGQPAQPTAAPSPRPKLVTPMKGTAVIEVLRPVVKVQGKEVVTTLRLKNASYGPIAGLRVDEYWFDKQGNLLPGDSQRLKAVLMPDEEATIELRTPKDPRMDRNSYQFSHINGKVRADTVAKFSK
jgi:hypothetical protein